MRYLQYEDTNSRIKIIYEIIFVNCALFLCLVNYRSDNIHLKYFNGNFANSYQHESSIMHLLKRRAPQA